MRTRLWSVVLAFVGSVVSAPSGAQNCPCPPAVTPGWHGSAGAGLALTAGNSDTQTFNLSLALIYDPQTKHVTRIDGLYLKSRADGEDLSARSALGVRQERKLGRSFLFGEGRFERDRFKQLDYLIT